MDVVHEIVSGYVFERFQISPNLSRYSIIQCYHSVAIYKKPNVCINVFYWIFLQGKSQEKFHKISPIICMTYFLVLCMQCIFPLLTFSSVKKSKGLHTCKALLVGPT